MKKVKTLTVPLECSGAYLLAWIIKNLPVVQETWVRSLGWEDSLKKEMAIHSIFLPGESQGKRNLEDYIPWGCKESGMTE